MLMKKKNQIFLKMTSCHFGEGLYGCLLAIICDEYGF